MKDDDGRTPLQVVLTGINDERGIEVVKLLVSAGADVNVKDDEIGYTPLHWLASTRLTSEQVVEVAKFFISAGADVNAKSKEGWTPLHCAAREGKDVTLVKLLVSAQIVSFPLCTLRNLCVLYFFSFCS